MNQMVSVVIVRNLNHLHSHALYGTESEIKQTLPKTEIKICIVLYQQCKGHRSSDIKLNV